MNTKMLILYEIDKSTGRCEIWATPSTSAGISGWNGTQTGDLCLALAWIYGLQSHQKNLRIGSSPRAEYQ